mmetsp:Transcript_25312/g.75556  ORF Transcript_25312/g.75556 Transcript_25312/m.75556 type:complete len:216 (-) Transcript_25312:310-957(-)
MGASTTVDAARLRPGRPPLRRAPRPAEAEGSCGLPRGRSSGPRELEPSVASSRDINCFRKPALGRLWGRRALTNDKASARGFRSRVRRYARHSDTERLLPSWQCTKARPPAWTASSITRRPSSNIWRSSWSSVSSRARRCHLRSPPRTSSEGASRSAVQFTMSVTPNLRSKWKQQAVTGPTSKGEGARSEGRRTVLAVIMTLAREMSCCSLTRSS